MSKAASESPASEDQPLSLQAQMDQLTALVEKMESPDTSLEESLSLYEQGMALVRGASAALDAAEQRVALVNEDGSVQALEE